MSLSSVLSGVTGIVSTVQGLIGSGSGGGFDINAFQATALNPNGVQRTSHFYVQITPPKSLNGSVSMIPFLCKASPLPGVTLQVDDTIRRWGVGTPESRPYGAVFPDLDLLFIGDGNAEMINFFTSWINNIVQWNSGNPNGSNYEVGYFDDYAGVVNIFTLDSSGSQILNYTLNNAYPYKSGDISLNWDHQDEYAVLPVRFAYKDWTSNISKNGNIFNILQNGVGGFFGAVSGVQNNIQNLTSSFGRL